MALLDVSSLPFERTYACHDGTHINMRRFLENFRIGLRYMGQMELIKDTPSFGFAMTQPVIEEEEVHDNWDHPEQFVWFAGGWGPDRDRYIANAVRKLRPLIREGQDSTLEMRYRWRDQFEGTVDSVDQNGDYPWGDFPWGGAVRIDVSFLVLRGAVSCYKEMEDDGVAYLILRLLGQHIALGDELPMQI